MIVKETIHANGVDIGIYTSDFQNIENETVWLNRNQMAELFDRDVKTIGKHINNALKEELDYGESTVAKFATVQKEGEREVERQIEFYNLDVIISVTHKLRVGYPPTK